MNEYGNDTACANCGDEWSKLDEHSHCQECAQVREGHAK